MNLINIRWGGHCFRSSRNRRTTGGKITTFKLGHPVFDSGIRWLFSPNVSLRMSRISFGALPCRRKKNLMTARVSLLLKSRASPDFLPFSLRKKEKTAICALEQTPVSNDTIDSFLRHREIGRVKLSAPHVMSFTSFHCQTAVVSACKLNLTELN